MTSLSPEPEPTVDPPEPPRPDELDTISPGMNDESGRLPRDPEEVLTAPDDTSTDAATEEPSA